jgi:hypothetical protein
MKNNHRLGSIHDLIRKMTIRGLIRTMMTIRGLIRMMMTIRGLIRTMDDGYKSSRLVVQQKRMKRMPQRKSASKRSNNENSINYSIQILCNINLNGC